MVASVFDPGSVSSVKTGCPPDGSGGAPCCKSVCPRTTLLVIPFVLTFCRPLLSGSLEWYLREWNTRQIYFHGRWMEGNVCSPFTLGSSEESRASWCTGGRECSRRGGEGSERGIRGGDEIPHFTVLPWASPKLLWNFLSKSVLKNSITMLDPQRSPGCWLFIEQTEQHFLEVGIAHFLIL